jgi:beta propeller repeat protein
MLIAGSNIDIMRNTFENSDATGGDISFSSSSDNNIFLNRILGKEVQGQDTTDSFCVEYQGQDRGNFYKYTLTPTSGDCGPINITCPLIGSAWITEWNATQYIINGSFTEGQSVAVSDFDSDGHLDVVGSLGNPTKGVVAWWENDGGLPSEFTQYAMNESLFNDARDIAVGDLDGDGDLDVVGVSYVADDVVWWENDAGSPSHFTQHGINASIIEVSGVAVGDLDGDGHLDVVGASAVDGVVWWENNGTGSFYGNQRELDASFTDAFGMEVAVGDMDSDGHLDVLGASVGDGIVWWENDGSGEFYDDQEIDDTFTGVYGIAVGDLDGDGDLDVVGAADETTDDVAWWKNNGASTPIFKPFKQPINDSFMGARDVAVGDLDGDGDLDIAGAGYADGFVWWENYDGHGDFYDHQHTINRSFDSARAVAVGDVDSDGDLEVLGATKNHGIAWWSLIPPYYQSSGSRCPDTALILRDSAGNPLSLVNETFYNISDITVAWKKQDSPLEITYYVDVFESSEWENLAVVPTVNYFPWDVSDVFSNTEFNLSVTPYDDYVNGTVNWTNEFNISNDADGDTYSILSTGTGDLSKYGDCNDQNSSIHPPNTRENDTDPDISNACYDAFDEDCDNYIDWLDEGCGHGFTPGSFNDEIYINGTIDDLSTCHIKGSGYTPGTYYVLIEDNNGLIEYHTPKNLVGVDFDDIFTIAHNYISADPSATYGDRFNKTATVTFLNLVEYDKIPVILVDGWPCPDHICSNQYPNNQPSNDDFSDFGNDLTFTSAHFSTYTTTNSSRLGIFNQNDSEAAAVSAEYPTSIETYHRIQFYANYTRYPDGVPINDLEPDPGDTDDREHNGECNITLKLPSGTPIDSARDIPMEYDDFYGVYWHKSGVYNFTGPSDYYSYTINCKSNLYESVNVSETFSVTEDNTPPDRPTLYPQLLLHPTNLTTDSYTWVAGYFGESDIDYTIMLLHGTYTYTFDGQTDFSGLYSEYKGDDIIVNFAASKGQNVTFTAWNPTIEEALQHFDYLEFANHNRSYFDRYNISRANRTGDDIRIEFNQTLSEDVPIGTKMRLYTAPHPSGYFKKLVPNLFPGINRISAWGVDQASNAGNATHDWINAPYPTTSPEAAELWPLPEAIKYEIDNNLDIIGFINESTTENLNMTINFVQGYDFNIEWAVGTTYVLNTTCEVDIPAIGAGNYTFNITACSGTIDELIPLDNVWLGFTNHDGWYNKTDITLRAGSDYNVTISTALESGIDTTVNVSFYLRTGGNVDNLFTYSHLLAESPVSDSVPVGNNFFYILDHDYNRIGSSNFSIFWVEFSNHNRTYWKRYNVTHTENNPDEPARIYVEPALEASVGSGVQAYFYNSSERQGFFNISVNRTKIWNGSSDMYAVAFRYDPSWPIPIEGWPSEHRSIYLDSEYPQLDISGIPNYTYTRTPTFRFNLTDDYKIDIGSLLVNITNMSDVSNYYAYNSSAFPTLDVWKNISCTDLLDNQSLYECSFQLNRTENSTYVVNVSVNDLAGWHNHTNKSMKIIVTTIDVTTVYDEDDITNDLWLLFNWTAGPLAELDQYEFALGTAQYPDSDFNSIKDWNNSCDVVGSCTQDWINFTHNRTGTNYTDIIMKTGTVYYLTVRAKNKAGEYGEYASSDGILFIDQTPPVFRYIDDNGPWTNSNSQLSATWLFEDNESEIIEYMYTLGNASYPDPGYNSIAGPTLVGSSSVMNDALSLTENATYYYSVKARNGNVAMNYSGSWSSWYSSSGVQVDTFPPSGGFIYWLPQTYATSGFVTLQYNVGVDDNGASDNVKGLIQYGRGQLVNDVCPSISDFDWHNTSDILPSGSSYRDINVTTGYCYVFRLYAWDNASNGVTYITTNETLKVIKADTTPPTDVDPVIDDGFFTNSRSSLHANWEDSSDPESGFDYYGWSIYQEPAAGGRPCVVNTTAPIGTNCTYVIGGNTTVSEISLNNLNLTHNHKHYFEVRAWNKAGLNSTTRYSDGIIYLDNAPPGNITILGVNGVNVTSSPYYTENRTNVIEILALGDLDGYNDIANCVVLNANIDYREDSPYAENCTENISVDHGDYTDVTFINCTRNTTTSEAREGTWTWYLSCRDHYWNTQTYAQNTPVEFTVDWPDPPEFDYLNLTNTLGSVDILSNQNMYCEATVHDPDEDQNLNTTLQFSWYRGQNLVRPTIPVDSVNNGDGTYTADNVLSSSYSYRGNQITCNVTATDDEGHWRNESISRIIQNTQPEYLFTLLPDANTVNENLTFWWVGPFDDGDHDYMTVEIQIDNETEFNASNNPDMEFGSVTQLMVGGSPIPETQQNPDIYRSLIVYEDNRAGNLDIYMYDIESDTETPISTASGDQTNPKVYGDYVAYESAGGVYLYNINTAVTRAVVGAITAGTMDFFGNSIVYDDGSGIRMKKVYDLSNEMSVSSMTGTDLGVYGNNTWWSNNSVIWMNDSSNISVWSTNLQGVGGLFGYFLFNELGTDINVTNLMNLSEVIQLQGSAARIYGNKITYENSTGPNIVVTDLLSSNAVNVSLGIGDNPAIYDRIVVFENGDDLFYAEQNLTLRSRFIVDEDMDDFGYTIDTRNSNDERYVWRMRGCDNSFANNSCVWGVTVFAGDPYAEFTVDNTPPEISSISPADGSIVAGQFRLYANIVDEGGTVDYANYTLTYSNGTLRSEGDLIQAGTVWMTARPLDFYDINRSGFNLTIWAQDYMDNWGTASSGFTVNNDTAWFMFGGRGGTEIIDGDTIFNDTIDSDFIAFTVLSSTIKIVGPLPSPNTRFIQSKNNLTITIHNYSDNVSTLTWPDGEYKAIFTGTNLNGSNGRNVTFYVDHNAPQWSDPVPNATTVFASDPLTLSIYWDDIRLREVNITFNNTNSTISDMQINRSEGTLARDTYESDTLDIRSFINKTFYWKSIARDGLNRTNDTTDTVGWFNVTIRSDPPQAVNTILPIDTDEDYPLTLVPPLDLSTYFTDDNTNINLAGPWAYLDNITYNITSPNCTTNVTFDLNTTSGDLYSITTHNNFTGYCLISANATDYYGEWNVSNFTLYVEPANDPPHFNATIPEMISKEDNTSGLVFNLTHYAEDIDGDTVFWSVVDYESSIVTPVYSSTNGNFNFSLVPNAWGEFNITFAITDNIILTPVLTNVTVTVNSVPDAPTKPAITNSTTGGQTPDIGSAANEEIDITWNASFDGDGDDRNYSIFYSNDSGVTWYTIVTDLVNATSYPWQSEDNITNDEQDIILNVSVTDGTDTNYSDQYGEFTVDNLPPQIDVVSPQIAYLIISPTGVGIVNVTTLEDCSCTFTMTAPTLGASIASSGTTDTTIHEATLTDLTANLSYSVNVSCWDTSVQNYNSTAIDFTAKSSSLEMISVSATPDVLIAGRPVNLTLEIFSVTPWEFLNLTINYSGSPIQYLNTSDFTNEINDSVSLTFNLTAIDTSTLGVHDVFIKKINNTNGDEFNDLNYLAVFTTYGAINQTLNIY